MTEERIVPGSPREEPLSQQPQSQQPHARQRKVVAGIVAACSVVLIGVSAVFLMPALGQDVSSDLLKTTSEQSSKAASGQEVQSPEDKAAADKAAAEGSAASDGEAASETGGGGAGATGVGNGAANYGAAGGGGNSATPDAGSPSGGSGSGEQPPQANTVSVSVSVSSEAAGSPVSGGTTATFAQGATVYDALMACGLSVNASSTSMGIYVSAIGGLAEFDKGGGSGWKYSVNGVVIMTASSNQVLRDGDAVSWFYTTMG